MGLGQREKKKKTMNCGKKKERINKNSHKHLRGFQNILDFKRNCFRQKRVGVAVQLGDISLRRHQNKVEIVEKERAPHETTNNNQYKNQGTS